MITLTSLADERLINANFLLIAADLDYTLTDFKKGHIEGLKNLEKTSGKELVSEFDNIFHLIHEEDTLINKKDWQKKSEFDQIVSDIKSLPLKSNKYGLRKYSREIFILVASKRLNIKLNKNNIEAGRDAYWQGVGDYSVFYPDAKIFLDKVRKKNIPLIIMTGSDSVMRVYDDTSLEYDPEFSKKYKENRVKKLNINYQELIIGDPYDKPSPLFFDRVETEIKRSGNFKKEEVVFIGDLFGADLKVPEERDYRTFLIKRQ